MSTFTSEENIKIQSMVDLFTTYFRFNINHKTLETLIVQGGMGVDISGFGLADAVARTGSMGTISTTGSLKLSELLKLNKKDIIGINNLVAVLDYEKNYELGKLSGADFIASGAGISPAIVRRIKNQGENKLIQHYWTIPIISNVGQLEKHISRNPGYIILENTDAGGHNGEGKGFEGTLEDYKKAGIDKKGNRIIFAGGVRTPMDFVTVLDHYFDAAQIGTAFLCSEEANYAGKELVLHSGEGMPPVVNVPSVTGLPAKGFPVGIMDGVLKGQQYNRLDCSQSKTAGCLADCNRIKDSAKAGGLDPDSVGNYCIMQTLRAVDIKYKGNYPPLFFSGAYPERIPKQWFPGLKPIPAGEIVGRYLIEAFDIIIDGSFRKNHDGRITDEHRSFLENSAGYYRTGGLMKAKIFDSK